MSQRTVYTCDNCGKEIDDATGLYRVTLTCVSGPNHVDLHSNTESGDFCGFCAQLLKTFLTPGPANNVRYLDIQPYDAS